MSKWIDFSVDERKAMIQGVVDTMHIDEAAAEKDKQTITICVPVLFMEKL